MSEQEAIGCMDSHERIRKAQTSGRSFKDPVEWLGRMDINRHDFPYASGLIADSFDEWYKKDAALSFTESWKWCIFDYTGKWLADSSGAREPGNPLWEQIVAVCLQTAGECTLQIEENGVETSFFAMPVGTRSNGEIFALLGCAMPTEQFAKGGRNAAEAMAKHFSTCFYRQFEYVFVTDLASVHIHEERESSRRSLLFQIVQRMYDSIDVDAVLTEVIASISAMYPGADLTLYMSQDHRRAHPQVKHLPLRWNQEDVCGKAFKSGRVALRTINEDNQLVEIGLPLGGKQGVYGVFHLVMRVPAHQNMDNMDMSFLSMVASTAGTAFENAKLYERSNQLIRELRMSNGLSERLNQSLQLGETFEAAFEGLLEMFEADYCCILHYSEDKDGLEAVMCNYPGLSNEIIEVGRGIGGKVYSLGEPVILTEYDQSGARSRLMDFTDSQSLIATPLSVGGEVRGAIMLAHRRPHYFSFDNFRLLQALAGQIGLAVGNALLHAEVHRLANRDSLTGLHARHYLDQSIKEMQNCDFCGTLVVVDIDNFKSVNDTYGHQKGDHILKQVSDILRASIRQGDLAARWGGEELALYLPQLNAQQAYVVAERIRLRVQKETDPSVTVSCGIAEWDWTEKDRASADSLFYRADMALYEAKNNGRNKVVVEAEVRQN
ncbi:diguanylate cyclase (GGDEF) domain-containing protein [Paenibacillus sophorae]|uniref:Diguanylate cyclase (GGDEF) domain-containing protein n=1 Tax=Paenibacillus sophorae TaxID=1333845 RepID=A0A1H8JRI6_9BACL|nr:sensor domain-containing diguanylate cyclase [Paenibacillus sophorae]QWU13459.1 sensor domain-containing diguanylate cyclase [Paenibacillus sophorae]SEN83322.1 diguanylate cyclase (GGDEF) domain-containing protein [Paenibacillus sophorae]